MKPSKQAGALWAKKQSKDGQQAWLPLIVHLIDTKNTINWLFNHWLSASQRQLLQGTLSEAEAQQLVELVGFIHDIGKATPAFQTKQSYDRDDELDDQLKAQLAYSGFLDLDKLCLASPNKSLHARAGEVIVDELGLPTAIGAVIGGHHGKPESSRPFEQLAAYTANYFQSDNDPELQAPWRQVQKDLLDLGLASAGYHSATEVPTIKQPQAVILEGLLIMADWLASSEYLDYEQTVPLFPLIALDQSWQSINLTTRFQAAISAWNLSDEWDPQRVQLEHAYQQRWGYEPRPVQKVMTAAIGALTDPGMVIVEAPMGLGKTEIALIAAEELAYRTGSDGVFIGLPTQATTNAMFERVDDWVSFLAHQQDKNLAIKLMHSKSQFNQTYRELPHAANIYMAEDDAGAVVVNDWFAGKKSILTKFTVGTIDNLLLMGLKQKHLFLRHLGFSGKVVIIDEVHAYDVYMDQYLYKAISWLGAYHVPIVILSATLPKAKRKALLEAYLIGKYGRKYKKQLVAPANWAETQAYPLLSLLDGCEIKQVEDFPGQSDQPPMKVQVKQLTGSDEELMSQVAAKIAAGGVAGVIVNTVKRAQTLAQLVPADIKLMVLHSAFLATDRTAQETALQAAIGKQGDRPTKLIVIGTQVLEQSLDIDFDVLYTDIAPMDLILQRIGRLHRHQIKRPQALQAPQVFIMGIQDQNDYGAGNEAVYGKYLLMKTAHFLKSTLTLPTDISPLVQQVYDPQTDGEVADLEAAKQKFDTDLAQERKKAKVFQIANPDLSTEATIHDWLGRDLGRVDQDEQKANAAVRDIKETLEVILVQQTSAGKFLLDGRPLASVSEQVIAQQVIRLPNAVTPRIDQAIQALETLTSHYFLGWQNSIWLKGALVLPLDQNLATDFEGWHLSYTATQGLSYIKEDEHG
ncbi:CRISPR-associated helicase/endonuclease Cas3 [Lactobacillus sp. CBA3606]|uniref:CRISPR-associated helicase/endonuclease Cas3 n=1 Tax=Lactobacillus sp. CBA3606 TaxID=2099789 RepID=UPI000CFB65C7|nr:CRISPR-associated helicase/endonuclease Cas3 [Lactobacillus sp. CBA3606]AVK64112.1 CRISPR-associated helicase/endonuclease Cas3 [Lactobacillus sp. CBA3606]